MTFVTLLRNRAWGFHFLDRERPCSSSPTTVADYDCVISSSLFQRALFHNSRRALFACSVTHQRSHRTARKTGVQSARSTSKPLVSHVLGHRRCNPLRLVILYCVHKNRIETKGESRSSAGKPVVRRWPMQHNDTSLRKKKMGRGRPLWIDAHFLDLSVS